MCCLIQTRACVEKVPDCFQCEGSSRVHHGCLLSCVCWHCLNIHECLCVCHSVCASALHVFIFSLHAVGSPSTTTIPMLRWVHPHDVALCHWVFGRSQDHSGALMAEEFKACLISLGYDVENDKQVGAPEQDGGKGVGVCQTSEQEGRDHCQSHSLLNTW